MKTDVITRLASGCGCAPDRPADESRRRMFRVMAGLAAGIGGLHGANAAEVQIRPGDRLVKATTESDPVALRAEDVLLRKPLLAYPFDPESRKIRSESRLSKLVLLRLDQAELDAQTKSRAAGGVLAFSSVCTHTGCDVNAWMAKTRQLLCYCHSSQFDPLDFGKVTDGPAPRSLPWLPLALAGDELMVAGAFSATPGAMTT